jgi:hypothetical protein
MRDASTHDIDISSILCCQSTYTPIEVLPPNHIVLTSNNATDNSSLHNSLTIPTLTFPPPGRVLKQEMDGMDRPRNILHLPFHWTSTFPNQIRTIQKYSSDTSTCQRFWLGHETATPPLPATAPEQQAKTAAGHSMTTLNRPISLSARDAISTVGPSR